MIAEEVFGLPVRGVVLDFMEKAAELRRGQFVNVRNLKVHGKLYFIAIAVKPGQFRDVRLIRFRNQHRVSRILIHHLAQLLEHVIHFRVVIRVFVLDIAVSIDVVSRPVWIVV